MSRIIPIDNQPIDATFFGEMRRLTDWITPDALEVEKLHKRLTEGITSPRDRITACWKWVADQVKYVKFVKGRIWINGRSSVQQDLWLLPESSIHVRVGNCATKSFLLASLLRNELPAEQVHCVLGNLYNGKPGGHAWLNLKLDNADYIMESTTPLVPPLVLSNVTKRYEPVHYFNDEEVLAVEGKTVMVPFTEAYSEWLASYLHWAYIESGGR